MDNKKERLEKVFYEARMMGRCKTQKEFAALVNVHPSTISNALKGDEKYLTDKLIIAVERWAQLEGITGNPAPKPQQDTRPDIRIPAATMDLYTSMAKSIDRLTALVERMQPGASTFAGVDYAPKNYRIEK